MPFLFSKHAIILKVLRSQDGGWKRHLSSLRVFRDTIIRFGGGVRFGWVNLAAELEGGKAFYRSISMLGRSIERSRIRKIPVLARILQTHRFWHYQPDYGSRKMFHEPEQRFHSRHDFELRINTLSRFEWLLSRFDLHKAAFLAKKQLRFHTSWKCFCSCFRDYSIRSFSIVFFLSFFLSLLLAKYLSHSLPSHTHPQTHTYTHTHTHTHTQSHINTASHINKYTPTHFLMKSSFSPERIIYSLALCS